MVGDGRHILAGCGLWWMVVGGGGHILAGGRWWIYFGCWWMVVDAGVSWWVVA